MHGALLNSETGVAIPLGEPEERIQYNIVLTDTTEPRGFNLKVGTGVS